jgi:hypothetical protein
MRYPQTAYGRQRSCSGRWWSRRRHVARTV